VADVTAAEPSSELVFLTERGSGPPLLLVHGLMMTGDMFETVVERFASRHRVIVPDLRGHGGSRRLPPPYSVRHLASDLSRLLIHLGIESAAVLGYSQGGAIAQQLALDHPEQCNRLVLGCTYAYNMATRREWVEGHVAPLLVRVLGPRRLAALGAAVGAKELDKDLAERLLNLVGEQDRTLMVSAWKETMAFDSRPRLAEIECPTLVVAGSDDQAVPMHHAKMLHDGIRGFAARRHRRRSPHLDLDAPRRVRAGDRSIPRSRAGAPWRVGFTTTIGRRSPRGARPLSHDGATA
jgi:3-oxoadipate enol-lactonase